MNAHQLPILWWHQPLSSSPRCLNLANFENKYTSNKTGRFFFFRVTWHCLQSCFALFLSQYCAYYLLSNQILLPNYFQLSKFGRKFKWSFLCFPKGLSKNTFAVVDIIILCYLKSTKCPKHMVFPGSKRRLELLCKQET